MMALYALIIARCLADYVLKPLYSFAGLGVDMEPTREKLDTLEKPQEWILQKKIQYAEFVPTVEGPRSKAEIRMMFIWPENREPTLVNNLVRMSQGKMMGVDLTKTKLGSARTSRCTKAHSQLFALHHLHCFGRSTDRHDFKLHKIAPVRSRSGRAIRLRSALVASKF